MSTKTTNPYVGFSGLNSHNRSMERRWAPRETPEQGGGGTGGQAGQQPPVPGPVALPLPPQTQLPPPAQTAPPAPVAQQPAPQQQAPTDWKAEAIRLRAEKEAAERVQQSTQSEVQQLRQAWEADRAQSQFQIRQGQLVAYRNQLLAGMAHMPAAFHALVFGQDENELYQRAQAAVTEFDRSRQEIEARIRQQMAGPGNAPQAQGQPGIPPGFQPQGTPSPHAPQQGGFPSPAPQQGPGANQPQAPLGQFANENGVRTGKWGQEREATLANLRQQLQGGFAPPPPFQGYMPVNNQPQPQYGMPHTQMPGGVQQPNPPPAPQYNQNAQNANFGQWQQPQAQFQAPPQQQAPQGFQQPQYPPQGYQAPQQQFQQLPPPPQQFDANAAAQQAQNAVDRTRQGQNPVLGQTPDGNAALGQFRRDAGQLGAHTGQTPQTAFHTRFQPSPPVGN